MKKILILIFLSCSMFFVISAFYTKATGKDYIGFQYVLKELSNAQVGFDLQQDINEVVASIQSLDSESGFGGSDVFSKISAIAKTLYYGVRFLFKFIVHTVIAGLNVCICVCRCIGLTIPYIRLSLGNSSTFPFPYSSGPGGITPVVPGRP